MKETKTKKAIRSVKSTAQHTVTKLKKPIETAKNASKHAWEEAVQKEHCPSCTCGDTDVKNEPSMAQSTVAALKKPVEKIKEVAKDVWEKGKEMHCPSCSCSDADKTKETDEIMKSLRALMQVDIDASEVYQEVITKIEDDKNIHDTLTLFRKEHLRHVDDLSKWIIDLGGQAPERSADLKGIILTGYAKLRSSIGGLKGALNAIHQSEKITNESYAHAVKLEIKDTKLKQLLVDGYEDEKRHIKYIEEKLGKME